MRAAALPLFPEPLPFLRPHIAGWQKDDLVVFADPRAPSLQRKGRVLVSLPHHNALVLRAECPDAIVEIAPSRCRKVTQ